MNRSIFDTKYRGRLVYFEQDGERVFGMVHHIECDEQDCHYVVWIVRKKGIDPVHIKSSELYLHRWEGGQGETLEELGE